MPGDVQSWAPSLAGLFAALVLEAGLVVLALVATVEWARAAIGSGVEEGRPSE